MGSALRIERFEEEFSFAAAEAAIAYRPLHIGREHRILGPRGAVMAANRPANELSLTVRATVIAAGALVGWAVPIALAARLFA